MWGRPDERDTGWTLDRMKLKAAIEITCKKIGEVLGYHYETVRTVFLPFMTPCKIQCSSRECLP
jgi:hypothetical protein